MESKTITKKQKITSIIAASSGNLVEWYDFYIYAFTAHYFAHLFSSSGNPTVELFSAYAVFALGFLMRPIGSWLFGSLADKIGRKKSMVYSVVLMAIGSFLIAILPTKDTVGDFAIIFLLIARMIQGLSVGGEYGIAATYLSELGSRGNRGFYSSFQYVTLIGGQLLAVFSAVIMETFFTEQELGSYAWRILFVVGGILALLSLLARKKMHDTTENIKTHKDRGSLKELFKYKKSLLMVLGFTAAGSLCFYTFTVYTKTFMINTAGIASQTSNYIMLGALFCYVIFQPIFGAIGDKVGRKNLLRAFCILGIICTYPLMVALGHINSAMMGFFIITLFLAILSLYTSVAGILKAELFPIHIRALGTGLSYAIANTIFGGTAPMLALKFKEVGFENGFFIYIVIMLIIALVVAWIMPSKTELD
ncbi:MFS transporter [Helicobacter cappadocius]|uniref:MFS transporter n=1 Tax=Helicobacter cappadocius TaxID=3063998 RepID=A0AA90T4U4_9HELI|nr:MULTISPECIES: MFS transporter [unclassified Helicobacter]MDO7253141.1 MFS transporter [Helicobacter sp. faydin-H75]MDP2538733.1 MFS transporter [Helicobacter sp. faydin-H76]